MEILQWDLTTYIECNTLGSNDNLLVHTSLGYYNVIRPHWCGGNTLNTNMKPNATLGVGIVQILHHKSLQYPHNTKVVPNYNIPLIGNANICYLSILILSMLENP
jgi:hypothetical protein